MRGKSLLNVMEQREILTSAFLDDIAEEVYKQIKNPPIKFSDAIMRVATVMETHNEEERKTKLYKEKFRDAATVLVARIAILALDL